VRVLWPHDERNGRVVHSRYHLVRGNLASEVREARSTTHCGVTAECVDETEWRNARQKNLIRLDAEIGNRSEALYREIAKL
jgi:hypothetical protein